MRLRSSLFSIYVYGADGLGSMPDISNLFSCWDLVMEIIPKS